MIALYACGRLFNKFLAYLKTCLIVNAERFAIPVVQAIDPEDFVWLLKEDGCTSARVSLVRFSKFNSDEPESIVYIEASAFTDAKRRIVYISPSGILMPINCALAERAPAEAAARLRPVLRAARHQRLHQQRIRLRHRSSRGLNHSTATTTALERSF